VLFFDDIAEFIVGDDFVKLAIRHFDKEFDPLVIGSVVIDNLACHSSAECSTIIHVSDEGETKKFVRTEVRKFEIGRINIQAGKVRGREEDGIGRLPRPQTCTMVVSMGIAEEGIGSNAFIPMMDVAGRETQTKMLAERKACRSMGELSSGFDGLLDTIGRDPAKVGTKKFQVGSAGRKIVLVDAEVVKQARNGSEHRLDSELLATAVDDEVDGIREVPGIATGISGMRVKVQGMKVKGCVKSEVSRREFVVHG
jgi:hypothetical protein